MTSDKSALEQYNALNPSLFDVLDRFEIHQPHRSEDEQHEVSLEIWLRPLENEEDDLRRLHLSFAGVKNLKVAFGGFMTFPTITIHSISHFQWEKLHYSVEDAENAAFSFFCRDFEACLEERNSSMI